MRASVYKEKKKNTNQKTTKTKVHCTSQMKQARNSNPNSSDFKEILTCDHCQTEYLENLY